MNLFSPERRASRTKRWRKRFPKFSLSSWHSSRIVESVCGAFRAGAQASRVVRWASGSQVVTALGSKSLRVEGLESRQLLTAVPFSGAYQQDFDTLPADAIPNSWMNESSLASWSLFRQDAQDGEAAIVTLEAGDGTSANPGFYRFASSPTSDAALGGIGGSTSYFEHPAPGDVAGWMAVALQNITGSTLDSIQIEYDGEQWRDSGHASAQTMVMEYGFGADFASVSAWTPAGAAFAFTSPQVGSAGPLDGNAAANRAEDVGGTLTSLNWTNGSTLWLRWVEREDVGFDHGLAIDNLSITAIPSNSPPTIEDQTFSAAEGSSPGAALGIVAASDAEGAVAFAIVPGPDSSLFNINENTGELTVVGTLDYEAADSHSLTVEVTDAGGLTASATITINLADVDEHDVTDVVDTNLADNQVAENAAVDATVGITALAEDQDGTANEVAYSLIDENGLAADAGGLFKIDASSGIVRVALDGIDYEAATSHAITVRAASADGSMKHAVYTIEVLPENDNAPTAEGKSFTVLEGGTATEANLNSGVSLLGDDADLPNDLLSVYPTPVSGPAHGTLTLSADGKFIYTHDDSENFSDSFTYRVVDQAGQSVTATVTITIMPVNDHAPAFATDDTVIMDEEDEDFFIDLEATDADLPAQTVTFSIDSTSPGAGADGSLFEIVNGNELRFLAPPSFELPADANANNVYEVTIVASDGNGLTTSQTIQITVQDVLEQMVVEEGTASGDVRLVRDGDYVQLEDENGNVVPGSRHLFANIGSIVVNGADNVDDKLVLDFSEGNPVAPGGLTFHGGAGGNDEIEIEADGFHYNKIAWSYTSSSDGSIDLDHTDSSFDATISYTGLEPVLVNVGSVDDAEFNLPAGSDAVLEAAGGGNLRLRSPSGDFEDTTFSAPADSLTINGDASLTITTAVTASTEIALNVTELTLNADLTAPSLVGTATIVTVDDVPAVDPAQIQDAIDVAASGAVVSVLDGLYNESLTIAKDVTLEGDGDGTTTLDAGAATTAIFISSGSSVAISGLGVSNFSSNGIRTQGDLTLTDSTVSGGLVGVWVDGGTLDMQSTIVAGAAIFGVQVSNGGDADIATSEITGAGTTSAGVIVSDGHADIVGSMLTGNSRGLLVNAAGTASLANSDLSNNSIGGVVNATATVVNASRNWWGVNSDTAVDAAAIGAVDFTPFLNSGADADAGARGFGGDFSHVHVTALGAQAGSSGRIQEGVDLLADGALTGSNRIVNVHAGAYAEQITVDQSLMLLGANAGVDARGRAALETVITSPVANATLGLVHITADDVKVDGFTIDGDGGISGGVALLDGAGQSNAARGIVVDADNAQIVNNRVLNIYRRGVQFWVNAGSAPVGGIVSRSEFDAIGSNDVLGGGNTGFAMLAFSDASFTDNLVNNSHVGAYLIQVYAPNVTPITVSGNEINARELGLALNEMSSSLPAITVSNNDVTTGDNGVGMLLWSVGGDLDFSGNTFTGSGNGDIGVYGWVGTASVPMDVTLSGGSISGYATGVQLTNQESAFGPAAANGAITLDGVAVNTAAGGTGVLIEDGGASAFSVHVNVTNNAQISTVGGTGITVSGANASADVENSGIDGNAIGLSLVDGAATVSGSQFTSNTIGVSVAGIGELTMGSSSIFGNIVGVDIVGGAATLTSNHIHDNGVGVRVEGATTLVMNDGSVNDNDTNGLLVLGDGTLQSITVDGTTFSGNAANGPTSVGQGDVTLFDFAGPAGTPSVANFTDVTINSANPDYAIQVRGRNGDLANDFLGLNPGSTAEVNFTNVNITGAQQRMGMLIQQYADLGGFSFTDVTFNSAADGGLVIFDAAGNLNLGNTTFHDTYVAGNGVGDGTGFDIATSINTVNATGVVFLDAANSPLDKTVLADNFAIEDRVGHAIDATAPLPGAALVDWVGSGPFDNAVFVTTESFTPSLSTVASIERGIDAAQAGWTVYVNSGTYVEQLDINKDLTLAGVGASTIIQAPSTLSLDNSFVYSGTTRQSVIAVRGDVDATIRDLAVDGAGQGAQVVPGNDFHGIGIHNANVTVDSVTISGVRDATLTGIQRGRAIFAGNDSGAHTVAVLDSVVSDYQKNGVDLRGSGLTVDVAGNTITGSGPTGLIAQNGIVVLGGATGTVSGNTVEDHDYTGADVATGVLLFSSGAVSVTGNFLNDNEVGLAATGATVAAGVQANDLTGNHVGLQASDDALVDAGGGSLGSTGGNILSGYTGVGGNYAIENLNEDVPNNVNVFAQNNNYGSAVPGAIEVVVFHTIDNPNHTQVFFSPALGPVAPAAVYVNDDWAGTGLGADPDAAYANGNVFGADAFASIQDAIDAVGPNATIYVLNGTYDEAVVVNKAGTQLLHLDTVAEPMDPNGATEATVTRTTGTNGVVIEVTADGVTIDDFHIIINRPNSTVGIGASNAASATFTGGSFDDLTITNNVITTIGDGGSVVSPFLSTAVSGIALLGNGTPFESVVIADNTVDLTTSGTGFQRRGVFLREIEASVTGNDLKGVANDLIVQFTSSATSTPTVIDDNTFRSGGLDVTENNSGGAVEVTNNQFLITTPSSSQSLVLKNVDAAPVLVQGNTFTGHALGISMGTSSGVTIDGNQFTPGAFANTADIVLDTANFTGGTPAAPFNPVTATITNNEFFGAADANNRVALAMYNRNPGAATPDYGPVTIGGVGAENTFHDGLDTYIYLDPATLGGAPVSAGFDASQNFFEVTGAAAGGDLPSAMTLAQLFELEDKIVHAVDVGALGLVTVRPGEVFVTQNSFLPPFTTTPSIQRGVDVVPVGGTVYVEAGAFNQTTLINKNIQLRGAGADVDPELRDLGNLPAETTVSVSGAGEVAFQVAAGLTDVTINGFNISGNGAALNGVAGHGHSGLKLLNNFVHDFVGVAVALETGVSDALVQFNDIYGSYDGVYLSTGASGITIRDNFIHDSTSTEGEVTFEGNNQNVTIRNNAFSGASAAGVYAFSGFGNDFTGTTILQNAFLGAAGVNNTNSATLNAAGNWWGAEHGPTSASNPWTGVQPTGATVTGNVLFTPWLTDGMDTAPNVSGFQPNAGDVVAPAGTTPDLATASDTGNPTDNLTSDATPTLEGDAEPGSLVQIGVWVDTALNPGVVDASEVTIIATDEADAMGDWSTTLGSLADGAYQFVARVIDLAGNESGWSAPLAVTIDSVISPTTIDLPAAFDSTSPNTSPVGTDSDNITNINTPTLTGTAEAGATVELFDGMSLVGTTVADGSGNWSISLGVLADGMHTFTAVAADLAGNESASSPLAVKIDTIGQPSSVPDMMTGTDNGVSNSDNITNDNTPTFTGTAEAGAFVELLLNDTIVLQSGIAAGGTWTLTSGIAIPNGAHSIKARVTDIAGNVSTSAALTPVVVDTVPPLADGGPNVIVVEGDLVTLTGTASDAGSGVSSTLWQFVSSTNGQVVPNSPGSLMFTPTSPGQYTFNYVVTDVAGNVSVDTVIVESTFTADFDIDGDVDGDDLDNWENGFGTEPGAIASEGDEDRDGDVDGRDLLAWQRQLGSALPAAVAAVVAPSSTTSVASSEASVLAEGGVTESSLAAMSFQEASSWWIAEPTSPLGESTRADVSEHVDAAFDAWSIKAVADDDNVAVLAVAATTAPTDQQSDEAAEEEFDPFDEAFSEELAAQL